MEILRTENLKKYYEQGASPVKAIDGVNISVAQGEFVATVGTSGSGMANDYNVTADGIYYICEKADSIPDTIVDTDGTLWRYVHTRIETEYVWRDNGYTGTRHVAGLYNKTSQDAYNLSSVPEWLGAYPINDHYYDNEYL